MIIKIAKNEKNLLEQAVGDNVYLDAVVLSDFLAYGDYGISSVYIFTDGANKPQGAFTVYGSSISATVKEGANIDELLDFCEMSPEIKSLELPVGAAKAAAERFNAKPDLHNIMLYNGKEKPESKLSIDFTPQLWQIYKLLQQVSPKFMRQSGFESWLVDKSHKRRHRIAELALVFDGGQAAATGGIYSKTPQYAVIESVATLPEFRGKGYATEIVCALVNKALKQGCKPVLSCGDGLVPFYQRLGFDKFDEFASICIK